MQISSMTAIGATLLIAGASEHAALSTNTATYLQTISDSAPWTLRDPPPVPNSDEPLGADPMASAELGPPAGTPAWLDQLNLVGFALRAG